jgi:hypothetical protein
MITSRQIEPQPERQARRSDRRPALVTAAPDPTLSWVAALRQTMGNAAVARGAMLSGVAALQRTAGNAAVTRLLQRNPVAEVEAGQEEKSRRPVAKRPADVVTHAAASKKGKATNAYGTFTYEITKNADSNGCNTKIAFEAFSPEVHSTKITIIQTARSSKAGGATYYPNNDTAYYSLLDPGTGQRTDALKAETDPFYNYEDKTGTDESTGTTGAKKTTMSDTPALNKLTGERGQTFESAPFVLAGTDEGEFLGTITWGWDIDPTGTFTLHDPAVHDEITTGFGGALLKFISRKHELTKTSTTPAPATLDMPADVCRDLTAAEKLMVKPFSEYAKAHAKARMWVVARYNGKGGKDIELASALDNARVVQKQLRDLGIADSSIHATALEDPLVKDRHTPVDITVIDT